ncbi:MAG: autotransporter outer membrane beta-barrel domain-containing protein, partial [Gammaproteobacteria bacterium]|nr:autotransporter outer membrane beta-barrel domain-containing protein [Gammaproteobacteria bacterium]
IAPQTTVSGYGSCRDVTLNGTMRHGDIPSHGSHLNSLSIGQNGQLELYAGLNAHSLIVDGPVTVADNPTTTPIMVNVYDGAYHRSQRLLALQASEIDLDLSQIQLQYLATGGLSYQAMPVIMNGTNNQSALYVEIQYPTDLNTSSLMNSNSAVSSFANYLNQYGSIALLDLLTNMNEAELTQALNELTPSRNQAPSTIVNNVVSNVMQVGQSMSQGAGSGASSALRRRAHQQVLYAIHDPLTARQETPVLGWMSGTVQSYHHEATDTNPALNAHAQTVTMGVDYHLNQSIWTISGGISNTHYKMKDDSADGHVHTQFFLPSVYAEYNDNWYIQPSFCFATNTVHNTRFFTFTSTTEQADFRQNTWQLIPQCEIGHTLPKTAFGKMTPFIAYSYVMNWADGYTETGSSGYNTQHAANYSNTTRVLAGSKIYQSFEYDWGLLNCTEKVSYLFDRASKETQTYSLEGIPGETIITGTQDAYNLLALGLEFEALIGKENPIDLTLTYYGEYNSDKQSNQVQLSMSYTF